MRAVSVWRKASAVVLGFVLSLVLCAWPSAIHAQGAIGGQAPLSALPAAHSARTTLQDASPRTATGMVSGHILWTDAEGH